MERVYSYNPGARTGLLSFNSVYFASKSLAIPVMTFNFCWTTLFSGDHPCLSNPKASKAEPLLVGEAAFCYSKVKA